MGRIYISHPGDQINNIRIVELEQENDTSARLEFYPTSKNKVRKLSSLLGVRDMFKAVVSAVKRCASWNHFKHIDKIMNFNTIPNTMPVYS